MVFVIASATFDTASGLIIPADGSVSVSSRFDSDDKAFSSDCAQLSIADNPLDVLAGGCVAIRGKGVAFVVRSRNWTCSSMVGWLSEIVVVALGPFLVVVLSSRSSLVPIDACTRCSLPAQSRSAMYTPPHITHSLRGSFSPSGLGGLTRGIPKHCVFGHSSASIAHPFNKRLPISVDALSDCSRRRLLSGVSGGGANVGELRAAETSVGGVEDREAVWKWDVDEVLLEAVSD